MACKSPAVQAGGGLVSIALGEVTSGAKSMRLRTSTALPAIERAAPAAFLPGRIVRWTCTSSARIRRPPPSLPVNRPRPSSSYSIALLAEQGEQPRTSRSLLRLRCEGSFSLVQEFRILHALSYGGCRGRSRASRLPDHARYWIILAASGDEARKVGLNCSKHSPGKHCRIDNNLPRAFLPDPSVDQGTRNRTRPCGVLGGQDLHGSASP